jgi:acetyltransferase-like isoleucine patch superfamily enzyme
VRNRVPSHRRVKIDDRAWIEAGALIQTAVVVSILWS